MAAEFSRRVVARTVAAKLLAEPSRRSYWIKTLAAYLAERNRTSEAELIANDIAHELHVQGGKLLVGVTSAKGLDGSIRIELEKLLKSSANAKEVVLSEQVDPKLLGGLIARTPDAVIDLSIRSQLKQLATISTPHENSSSFRGDPVK